MKVDLECDLEMLLFGASPIKIWPGYCGRGDATRERMSGWLPPLPISELNARKQQPSIVAGQKLNTFDDGWMSFCDIAIGHARPIPVHEGMYRGIPRNKTEVWLTLTLPTVGMMRLM